MGDLTRSSLLDGFECEGSGILFWDGLVYFGRLGRRPARRDDIVAVDLRDMTLWSSSASLLRDLDRERRETSTPSTVEALAILAILRPEGHMERDDAVDGERTFPLA